MEKPKYKPAIISELFTLCEQNSELTMGEIFYSFLRPKHLNGKSILEALDEEIYVAIERANQLDFKEDILLSEEEFKEWVNNK